MGSLLLQIFGHIEARAFLRGVFVVAMQGGLGEHPLQRSDEREECLTLLGGAGVSRVPVLIQATDVADA